METFCQGFGTADIHQVPRGQKVTMQRMRSAERGAAGMAPKGPIFTRPHKRHLQHISWVGGGALPLKDLHRWEGQTRCPSQGTYTFGKFQIETECLLMLHYRLFWTDVKIFTVCGYLGKWFSPWRGQQSKKTARRVFRVFGNFQQKAQRDS